MPIISTGPRCKLVGDIGLVLVHVDHLLTEIDTQKLPAQLAGMLANVNRTVNLVQSKLNHVDSEQLSRQAQATLTQVSRVMSSVQSVMERIDGERGVLASVQRTSDGMGDVAASARESGPELAETMRDLREAVDSVRQLADTLELDSDMLLKGRARTTKP
jgi:methyl-accepting chemotaxis protein